ncbi:MAG: transketolase family protein [Thermoplasmata archaeon]
MTGAPTSESLVEACGRALVALGAADPKLLLLDSETAGLGPGRGFGERFPDRYTSSAPEPVTMMSTAVRLSSEGRPVFVSAAAEAAVGPAYATLRRSVVGPRANVKILATHGGPPPGDPGYAYPMLEDIGLMRGLPGMTVVVPADAATAESAIGAVAAETGPSYVRLTRQRLPPVTREPFRLGRAPVLRDGADLAIVAVGAMVARSVDLSAELAKVGVSVRVLDLASVKPFDEPALLRAARDTGAILVAEEHSVLTGIGALVASVTAENYPVPVRRIGVPDVFGERGDPGGPTDAFPLSLGRMTDEAWELLRLRGKVE